MGDEIAIQIELELTKAAAPAVEAAPELELVPA